jgi:hypothetical protein
MLPSPRKLTYFDHVDDDFPYDGTNMTPNTRTYVRPGAMTALRLCGMLGIVHVYTAAQGSYTDNVLRVIDAEDGLFRSVIHRDDYPQIVKEGKDLTICTMDMKRAVLFDDRSSNFRPQNYENGVSTRPFTPERVRECNDGRWGAYLFELLEMSRLAGIALWSTLHPSGDVRNVVRYVRECT